MVIRKTYTYQTFTQAGVYIDDLPNVTSDFTFTQTINAAGSQITVICALSADTSNLPVDYITAETGIDLSSEDGFLLTTERYGDVVGDDNSGILFQNGNRIKVYEYSSYNPTGKLVFSGEINRVTAHFGGDNPDDTIEILVYSDGAELDNYIIQGSPYSIDQSQTVNNSTATCFGGFPANLLAQLITIGNGITNIGAIDLFLAASNAQNVGTTVTVALYGTIAAANADGGLSASRALITATAVLTSTVGSVYKFIFNSPLNVSGYGQLFMVVLPEFFGKGSSAFNIGYDSATGYGGGAMYQYTYGPAWNSLTGSLYFVTYENSGATTAVYTSEDPSDMLKNFINSYISAGGSISYSASSIDETGLVLSYTFITNTIDDGLKAVLSLAPDGFYYYVDLGSDILYFKLAHQSADITLVKGVHINQLDLVLSIENIKNLLYFSGGLVGAENLYSNYSNGGSISEFGPRLDIQSDNRVIVQSTADAIGESFISENQAEQYQTTVQVLDSTIDLTLFKPGQIIGFAGFGNLVDRLLLQIVQIDYAPEIVKLTLGIMPKRIIPDFEKVRAGLIAEQTILNPSTPT